jgi:hypothetical protein
MIYKLCAFSHISGIENAGVLRQNNKVDFQKIVIRIRSRTYGKQRMDHWRNIRGIRELLAGLYPSCRC